MHDVKVYKLYLPEITIVVPFELNDGGNVPEVYEFDVLGSLTFGLSNHIKSI